MVLFPRSWNTTTPGKNSNDEQKAKIVQKLCKKHCKKYRGHTARQKYTKTAKLFCELQFTENFRKNGRRQTFLSAVFFCPKRKKREKQRKNRPGTFPDLFPYDDDHDLMRQAARLHAARIQNPGTSAVPDESYPSSEGSTSPSRDLPPPDKYFPEVPSGQASA